MQNADKLRLFALLSHTGRPLGLFYKKKGAVGLAPSAQVCSLAAEGGQMEEVKTCLKEYLLPQRVNNGNNRVPKAAFEQTGRHSLGILCCCVYGKGLEHPLALIIVTK